ncbi:MAG: D-aminoacyl-tRNA deacylase [Nitrospinota bacterium]
MRAVLQRVSEAGVAVAGETKGAIGPGLLILLGVGEGDTEDDVRKLAEKVVHLRIFEDDQGKFNRSLLDVGGAALVVSQFTLFADCRKGRRPSFVEAAKPPVAEALYEKFGEALRSRGVPVETGVFGAMMDVRLNNRGPVTLWLDSREL